MPFEKSSLGFKDFLYLAGANWQPAASATGCQPDFVGQPFDIRGQSRSYGGTV